MAPRWDVYVGDPSSPDGDAPVPLLSGRRFKRALDVPDEFSFRYNGRQSNVPILDPLETDLWLRRTPSGSTVSQAIQRFRVFPTSDELTPSTHQAEVTGKSYEAILARRFLYPTDTLYFPVGTDSGTIAWYLANVSQGRAGGALGITQGTMTVSGAVAGSFLTGHPNERTYTPGQVLGTLLSQLANVNNGFDYEIDYNRRLNIWWPKRGKTSVIELLQFGGNVNYLKRTFNEADYANAVGASGDQATTPELRASGTVGSDLRGRWEDWVADPSWKEQATVADNADEQLALRSMPSYSYEVRLRRGVWQGLSHIDVGDHVNLVGRSGRVDIDVEGRVLQLDVAIGDHGDEDVALTVEEV